jgi:hypothetical protein
MPTPQATEYFKCYGRSTAHATKYRSPFTSAHPPAPRDWHAAHPKPTPCAASKRAKNSPIPGDIFDSAAPPTFAIKVIGTRPVAKLSIIRDGEVLHVEEPKQAEVALTYTDQDAAVGQTSYYYVRVEQSDGNLAWASPMWITYKGK